MAASSQTIKAWFDTTIAATTPLYEAAVLFVANTDSEPIEQVPINQCSNRKFRTVVRDDTFEIVKPYGGGAMECVQIFEVKILYLAENDSTSMRRISSDREALAVSLLSPGNVFPSVLCNIEIVPGQAYVRNVQESVLVVTIPFRVTFDTAAP